MKRCEKAACHDKADEAFRAGFMLAEGDSSGAWPPVTIAPLVWAAERLGIEVSELVGRYGEGAETTTG